MYVTKQCYVYNIWNIWNVLLQAYCKKGLINIIQNHLFLIQDGIDSFTEISFSMNILRWNIFHSKVAESNRNNMLKYKYYVYVRNDKNNVSKRFCF